MAGVIEIQYGKVFYSDVQRRTEFLYVHFIGLKRWWHWLGFRRQSAIYRLSPVGYGGPALAANLWTFPWRQIWSCQIFLLRAKSFAGSMLRQVLPTSAFLFARRLVFGKGRY